MLVHTRPFCIWDKDLTVMTLSSLGSKLEIRLGHGLDKSPCFSAYVCMEKAKFCVRTPLSQELEEIFESNIYVLHSTLYLTKQWVWFAFSKQLTFPWRRLGRERFSELVFYRKSVSCSQHCSLSVLLKLCILTLLTFCFPFFVHICFISTFNIFLN